VAEPLSWGLREQVILVSGTAFWYKPPLHSLLARTGVPAPLIRKYQDESKFKLVRFILDELDEQGETGFAIQHRLVRDLARMQVTDPSVSKEDAEAAIATLRTMAQEEGLLEDPAVKAAEAAKAKERRAESDARQRAIGDYRRQLEELCGEWRALVAADGKPQQRGYDLEALFGDLLKLHDIPYQPPYRKGSLEQTDGFFKFGSYSYLIEARWRKNQPNLNELSAFSAKVTRKIESTRGLFISYPGFRPAVLAEASNVRNVIYVSGEDLNLILEDRVPLVKALETKDEQAARFGVFYFPLSKLI
jgi:hypothetical protein